MMVRIPKSSLLRVFSLLACMLAACASPLGPVEAPQVTIADLRLSDLTLFEQQYSLRLRVKNPNPFDLPITGMAFTLKLNDIEFAQGVSRESMTLPAYDEESFEVSVTSNLASVMEQFSAQRASPSEQLHYELAGHVSVSGVSDRIEFSHRGRFGPPR